MRENPKQKKESNLSTMLENSKQKKGSNPSTMLENSKQKERIESGHDVGEPEIKRRDRIRARCRRTRNKKKGLNSGMILENPKQKKGSNPGTMPENSKQNERTESRHDAREPEIKRRDRIHARCWRT